MTSRVGKGRVPHTEASDDEILALRDLGLSQRDIATRFASEGRTPGTQQGVAFRLKKITGGQQQKADRILPVTWKVRMAHADGWIYQAALAYAKWRKGQGVSQKQLAMARSLENKLTRMDAVLTYDREQGFMVRARRPEDAGLLA